MKNNNWVLITGASSGIGLEFAHVFAAQHNNLVLCARDEQKMRETAAVIEKQHGVETRVIKKDLAAPDSAKQLFDEIDQMNIDVSILVNNAGAGKSGLFKDADIQTDMQIIHLNVGALTALTKLAAAHMAQRDGGRILNVASTGAYQPGPYTAVYYATKAYVLSLTQALRREFRHSRISVCTLCPGATLTAFSKRSGKRDTKRAMSARKVAQLGYKGLMKNKGVIIPGAVNKFLIAFSKLLPGAVSAAVVENIQKKLVISKANHQ